ncbi:TNF receptor-associated factor 3-like [Ptychodera flava]|uniref:TNF receptor-associated factor 3-like n=1 Tax=Ptychodera flava TaxID=63121 RepID=UPI003969D67E
MSGEGGQVNPSRTTWRCRRCATVFTDDTPKRKAECDIHYLCKSCFESFQSKAEPCALCCDSSLDQRDESRPEISSHAQVTDDPRQAAEDNEEIQCFMSGCRKKIKRCNLVYHLHQECMEALYECEECNKQLTRRDYENHICYLVKEVRNLNEGTKRTLKVEKHIAVEEKEIISEMKTLMMSFPAWEDNKGLSDKMADLEARVLNLEEEIARHGKRATDSGLERKLNDVINKTAATDEKLRQQNEQLQAFKVTCNEMSNEMEQLKENSRKQEEKFEEQKTAILKMVKDQQRSIERAETNLTAMKETTYDGTFIWRIDNFEILRMDAISGGDAEKYSPPFYAGRHGPKMCLKLYLNGFNIGHGTHLSLFLVVMKGEYDNLQRWPFHHTVKLTLFDQSGHGHHIDDVIRPSDHQLSSAFRKPVDDMNVPFGSPLFAKLRDVFEFSRDKYMKDDVLFIKASVDMRD